MGPGNAILRLLFDSLFLSRHGESSVELSSVMILNPMVGNSPPKAVSGTVKHHMSNRLFVGNLSFNTTETQLRDEFSAHGVVTEVNLMVDRDTGRPRGFGFVTMDTPEEAQAAIAALSGKSIDGRDLTVKIGRAHV